MAARKKKKKIEKITISKDLVLAAEKPRYNAHQGGYGIQGEVKYKRNAKHKKDYRHDY